MRLIIIACLFCIGLGSLAQTNPVAHDLRDSPYIFTSFSANPASTTYPPSMQGWSGDVENLVLGVSADNQATGDQALCSFCPNDAGEIINSGINGIALQAEAVAPQTGRAFAVALALNTTDCFGVQVAWQGIEAAHNNDLNIGGLEMQYRVDSTGDWNAIPGQQYISNLTTFVTGLDYQEFSTQLPEECDNQPYVQLRWALYHVNNFVVGNSLAVSKINVQADSVARQVQEDPYCRPLANVACEGSAGAWSGARPALFINSFYSLLQGTLVGGGIDNQNSGCGLDQGYSDFTDQVWTTAPGEQLDYYIGYSSGAILFGATSDLPFANIYVDWNQDNDFEDVGETYPMINSFATFEILGEVAVPPTAVRGKTRMRVRISRDPIGDPCAPTADGEVEDYTVVVTSFVDCPSNPTPAVSDINVCQQGVTLSWDAPTDGETPTGYRLSLGDGDNPTGIYDDLDIGNVTSFTLPDNLTLDPATTYFWKVVSYDAEGSANGCSTWNFTTAANGDPHPGVSINGNSGSPGFGCFGSTDKLTARVDSGGAAPFSYEWMGANTQVLDRTDSATVFFTADTSGTYTYIVNILDDNGCSAQDTLVINTVQGASTGTVTASNDSLCADETLSLISVGPLASLQWQVSSDSVNWNDVQGAVRDTLEVLDPNDNTFYRLVASNIQCADTSEVFPVTVFPQTPAPNITTSSGVNFFCEGDSVTLYSDQENNAWSTGATTDSIVVDTTARIILAYTDANGCASDGDTLQIIESAFPDKPLIPEVTENGNLLICGTTAIATVQDSGLTVQWNDFPGETNDTLVVTTETTISVTVTNAFGCQAISDTATSVIRESPAKPDIGVLSGSLEFCSGDSVQLFSLIDIGNTVVWNNDTNITKQNITAKTSGKYYVEAFNDEGCSRVSDTLVVTVNALPPKPGIFSTSTKSIVCSNEEASVFTDAASFYWNGDTTITADTLQITEDGLYFVTAFTPSGCEQNSDSLSFTLAQAPDVPVVTADNGSLSVTGAGENAVYQWFNEDDTPVAGETDTLFANAPDGNYYVVVTDTVTGCSARSLTVTDIKDWKENTELTLFPNPVQQGAVVTVGASKSIKTITVKDAAGRTLQTQTESTLETGKLSAGVYLVIIAFEDASRSVQRRMIVQ